MLGDKVCTCVEPIFLTLGTVSICRVCGKREPRIGPVSDRLMGDWNEEKFWTWVRGMRTVEMQRAEAPRFFAFVNILVWVLHPIVSWGARDNWRMWRKVKAELKEVGL